MQKYHYRRGSVAKRRAVTGTKKGPDFVRRENNLDYFIINTKMDEIDANDEASQQLLEES